MEDTDTTLSEIEERFGPEVRRVVEELTDDKTLPKAERKRLQVERAAGSSARAKLVKLADKLHNLRDLRRCAPKGLPAPRPGLAPCGHGAGSDAPRVSPQGGRRSACRSTSGGQRRWWAACAGRARRWRRRCGGCWRSAAWRWGRKRGNKCGGCRFASPSWLPRALPARGHVTLGASGARVPVARGFRRNRGLAAAFRAPRRLRHGLHRPA